MVIPAHRVAETLDAAIRSSLAASVDELEVLVVLDGADDALEAVVAAFAGDARVRVLRHDLPRGPAAARNAGLAQAEGSLVLFLDGDDELTTGALDSLAAALGDGDVAVCGRFLAVDTTGSPMDIGTWANEQLRPVLRRRGRMVPADHLTAEALLSRLVVPPPGGVLARRASVVAVGGYDAAYHRSEDLGFLLDLTTVGRLAICDHTVLRYRRDPRQRSQSRSRRRGRQIALARMIRRGTSAGEVARRARGVAAHHVDRATVRWQSSNKAPRDLVAVVRGLLLALAFRVSGVLVATSRGLGLEAPKHPTRILPGADWHADIA